MSISVAESSQESIKVGQLSIRYLLDGVANGGMGVFESAKRPGHSLF